MDGKAIILNTVSEMFDLRIDITRRCFHESGKVPVNYISLRICSNKPFEVNMKPTVTIIKLSVIYLTNKK